MKKIILLAGCLFLLRQAFAQNELRVFSYNIRYDNPGDSLNAWPYRVDKVSSQIRFHEVHLIGLQEALHHQLEDLRSRLPRYRWTGVGRADGRKKGEYSAILYDTARLILLSSATFWLAEETTVAGKKGWDAAIERIVTWAKFRDRRTGKAFYHFNTHFDHMGPIARRESARLLLLQVSAIAGGSPVVVTGDFNAKPTDEPIRLITDKKDPNHLVDASEVSFNPHFGPTGTFNAFQSKETSNEPIDYIFIRNKVRVLKHATLAPSWEGRFASDHFAVMVELVIPG